MGLGEEYLRRRREDCLTVQAGLIWKAAWILYLEGIRLQNLTEIQGTCRALGRGRTSQNLGQVGFAKSLIMLEGTHACFPGEYFEAEKPVLNNSFSQRRSSSGSRVVVGRCRPRGVGTTRGHCCHLGMK